MEACEHVLAADRCGPALSDDFTDRVMSEISERRGIARRRLLNTRVALAAGALIQAAAVVALVAYWPTSHSPSTGDALKTVANAGAAPSTSTELDEAIRARDRIGLVNYMLRKADEIAAANVNLRNDWRIPARYASALSLPEDVAGFPFLNPAGLLRALVPPQEDPPQLESDEHSL
jgi:hypothetical protein